jgi:tRNA modification GTPase
VRSRAALAAADVALLVLDASQPPTDADAAIAALTEDKPTIAVLNKIDLLDEDKETRRQGDNEREAAFPLSLSPHLLVSDKQIRRQGDNERESVLPVSPSPCLPVSLSHVAAVVATSALTGAGLDDLAQAITTLLLGGAALGGAHMVSNPRHRDALDRAAGHLRDALEGNRCGRSPDLLAVDITAALTALGAITGEAVDEDLLAAIFSRFCIGK